MDLIKGIFTVGLFIGLFYALIPGNLLCLPPNSLARCETELNIGSDNSSVSQCTQAFGYNGGVFNQAAVAVHAFVFFLVLVFISRASQYFMKWYA